jgi:hypothetical protein
VLNNSWGIWESSVYTIIFNLLSQKFKCKKGKVAFVLLAEYHAMMAYWGSGGKAPCFLDLSTR